MDDNDENVLQEYSDSIKFLKKQSLEAGLSEAEFRKMYFESLRLLEKTPPQEISKSSRHFITQRRIIFLVATTIIAISIYNYKFIYTSIVCSLQEFIYPGLRLLRKMSIPIISLFPSLTDLYHETCLLQNPFFTVVDMDCWPCSSVNHIREIHQPSKPVDPQYKAPFIYETDQNVITLEALRSIYIKNIGVFDNEAAKISIGNNKYTTPHDLFTRKKLDNELYTWKLNNMNVARILRQFIPRPKIVPKFGQSTERFIIIDSSQGMFKIPETECSFSFLLSLSGTRTINLIPAEECKHQCKSMKVELKETYLLWYNWWYWRPVVQQSSSNVTFIAHIGSYC